MIEIVPRSGPPDALNCAALICDACRQQVTGPGNIIWYVKREPQRLTSPLFVAHKKCHRALEIILDTVYPEDLGWMDLWEEAESFLKHLGHNASHDFSDDEDGTYHEQHVAHPGGLVLPTVLRNTRSVID